MHLMARIEKGVGINVKASNLISNKMELNPGIG